MLNGVKRSTPSLNLRDSVQLDLLSIQNTARFPWLYNKRVRYSGDHFICPRLSPDKRYDKSTK